MECLRSHFKGIVMSEEKIEFIVPITNIVDISPHPNADRLEIAKCFDFNVVVRKGQYQKNDSVIYTPIDSLLPQELETIIFGPESKIKLTNGRVKQIRIRGLASQGMIIDLKDVGTYFKQLPTIGDNVAFILGITKHEPPEAFYAANQPKTKKERNKPWENPYFHSYGGLNNFKYYANSPDLFVEGQEVVYQEKIHGTNGRAGLLPFKPKTFWQKFLKFIGKLPEYQFTYGSNTVQLQEKPFNGYYSTNLYLEAVKKYNLELKLLPNETVYFEIYGSGIQKGYSYGHKEYERSIAIFDVKILSDDKKSNRWLSVDEVKSWCKERNLPVVPELYRGPHSISAAKIYSEGDSKIGDQKIREGIVIRDPHETVCYYGKKVFKLLSEKYLDGDNSDFH